ncbi:MAG: cytochrome c [Deltaproteobacteria bacterium]
MKSVLFGIAVVALAAALGASCKQDCPPSPTPATPTTTPTTTTPPTPTPTMPPPASPDHLPPGVNAVQNEMRLLHEAMRATVSAIALDTLSTIPERLDAVHRARELTEHAVESGTYKLSRNGDQLEAFKALDESFHTELEKLDAAARANDPVATSTALGTVMGRCEGCHAQFRNGR